MSTFLLRLWIVVALLLIGAVSGILVVTMLDPACGPWGEEQKQCLREIVDDLTDLEE